MLPAAVEIAKLFQNFPSQDFSSFHDISTLLFNWSHRTQWNQFPFTKCFAMKRWKEEMFTLKVFLPSRFLIKQIICDISGQNSLIISPFAGQNFSLANLIWNCRRKASTEFNSIYISFSVRATSFPEPDVKKLSYKQVEHHFPKFWCQRVDKLPVPKYRPSFNQMCVRQISFSRVDTTEIVFMFKVCSLMFAMCVTFCEHSM